MFMWCLYIYIYIYITIHMCVLSMLGYDVPLCVLL